MVDLCLFLCFFVVCLICLFLKQKSKGGCKQYVVFLLLWHVLFELYVHLWLVCLRFVSFLYVFFVVLLVILLDQFFVSALQLWSLKGNVSILYI